MNYLQQVIQFLFFLTPANEQEATLTLHDFYYYGSEVELVGGGEEVILWEGGEPHRCPVQEDRGLWFLVLLARFAVGLWGDKALAQTEERYCHFRVAAEDILREQSWPEGNLREVGGEEVVEAARSWPHYNDLSAALQPLLAAMYNND